MSNKIKNLVKKIECKKVGIQKKIFHNEFSKIRITSILLLITFGIVLFPNPFLINPIIQIENNNQGIEEINFSKDFSLGFDKLTINSKINDILSYFWESINAFVFLSLIQDLSLQLIIH